MPFPQLIANLVCPLLGAAVIAAPLTRSFGDNRGRWVYWGSAGVAVLWVYALTFADRRFGWWAAGGMDFSTHLGVAVVLAIALGYGERRVRLLLAGILIGYAVLMFRLGYHSALDMATSAAVTAPVGFAVARLAQRGRRARAFLTPAP